MRAMYPNPMHAAYFTGMPRVKGTPKQKDATPATEFVISPAAATTAITATSTTAAAVTSIAAPPVTIPDPMQAFALISKVIQTGNFLPFPPIDAKTNQLIPPLGLNISPSPILTTSPPPPPPPHPPPPLFFLPEKVNSQPLRDRDREMISCSVCQKTMRRGSLREHMDRHENSGKFECELCGKNFSRASAREKHIRTHTGERPFQCELCPKAYRQKVHLNEHMRSHSGERPFVCRLCGFSLASKSLLNRHLRTHGVKNGANEAPDMWLRTDAPKSQVLAAAGAVGRSIDRCEKGGLDEDPNAVHVTALNAMATVAALGRKHLCSECPAGFPTIQALRSHRVTTHGLVVEHACETCGATFTSKKGLKVHLRTEHPQICPLCEQVMPQRRRWVLEVHIRENHPGVSADTVIGPSPLATAAAAAASSGGGRGKRVRSRREKTAPKRRRTTRQTPANEAPDDGASTDAKRSGPTEVDDWKACDKNGSRSVEYLSDTEEGESSLVAALREVKSDEEDRVEDCGGEESPKTRLKLHFTPLSKQPEKNVSSVHTNAS
ncbi:unnamed protein product [Mesocestoides corti]|uniref:C2H2-type domain-containing protein n=2 Tax=Mesocestoides corti TaxID=53468 RepID=A0A0R3U608_MESCO|nr:unnamed protein product [Mesocestoides corti]